MNSRKPEIWCVIPVFNHATTLRDVVGKTLERCPNVIVVDDGSTDADIAEILDGLDIELASHDNNRGKGEAIKTGADIAKRKNADFVVTIDADGQHDPADIDKFIPLLDTADPKIIVGSRDFDSSNVPDRSKFGREFSNFWIRFETGLDVRDTQSGFRAYPVDTLLDPAVSAKHYAFETEVLVKAAWKGVEVVNVDISVFYPEKGERVSHFKIFRDNFRISLLHARLTAERLLRGNRAEKTERPDGTKTKTIDAASPSASAETAEILSKPGAVALIPTETVYGLACRWDDEAARAKTKEMKGRDASKPFQMLADSVETAEKNGAKLDGGRRSLVEHFAPGPITFIVDADNAESSVGFRIPDNEFVLALIKKLGEPLAATSANQSGAPPATTAETALAALLPAPDAAVDAGKIEGDASTVADIRGDSVEILRPGPVSKRELDEQWKKLVQKIAE